jgi:hypothetical protein
MLVIDAVLAQTPVKKLVEACPPRQVTYDNIKYRWRREIPVSLERLFQR